MKLIEKIILWAAKRRIEEKVRKELEEYEERVSRAIGKGTQEVRGTTQQSTIQHGIQKLQEKEEVIPGVQGRIARQLFKKLASELSAQYISFGGGTVLAARWKHRESFDVDLFCQPEIYARLAPVERARIESRLQEIPGCNKEVTWCEEIAIYTEIDGIEATMLPRPNSLETGQRKQLRGTSLQLQNSEEILYGKIANRMYGSGEIVLRDAYDVACARYEDRGALNRAIGHMNKETVEYVIVTIQNLPKGWSEVEQKPLINPKYEWTEEELRTQVIRALSSANERRAGQEQGRG